MPRWVRSVKKTFAGESESGDWALLRGFCGWRGGFVFEMRVLYVVCCLW
jgi:hypothetical protein